MQESKKKAAYKVHEKAQEEHGFLPPFLYHQTSRNTHYGIGQEETCRNESCQSQFTETEAVDDIRNQWTQDVCDKGNHKPEYHNYNQEEYPSCSGRMLIY